MKLLSIAIPCYNSAEYMRNCIECLLPGGEDVEIIIVNDGSKDDTPRIADEYAAKYPTIVKAVHQENGGHGEAVNAGLRNATGIYFKVVDSDDKVNPTSYQLILKKLDELTHQGESVDMFISNYVYDKVGVKHKKVMQYRSMLPTDRIFGWNDVKHVRKAHYILMHSVIYRTQMLKDCGLELPKHTFYVDSIFVYYPLPHVKKMYYMDTNFYLYYIGREDQSVNEEIMIKRLDQQLRVNRIMLDAYNLRTLPNRKLRNYMFNYLEIITTVSSIMAIKSGTKEHLMDKAELWEYIKEKDRWLYRKLRHGIMGETMNLPGRGGRKVSVGVYKLTQKIFGFN